MAKEICNSFSTGGGGVHFEAHVQASFVTLMLTGGYAPCLPCWPIAEIRLQCKIDGFDTDDLIVFVENAGSKKRQKLLGQIKHSIAITQGSTLFGEVIQAAWNDFNNFQFKKGKDIIALITGPLSATDEHNVQWLLNQARYTASVDEFFRNVKQANFSPPKSNEKLNVIQHHLKAANGDNEVSKDELYNFLKHFHLLDYDLGTEFGVVLSLLHSHISQFQQLYPQLIWSRVVDVVQTWNQNAGTITFDKLPEDLQEAFKQKVVREEMPKKFMVAQGKPKTDWAQHPDATYLALAILIGTWNEESKNDIEVIIQLFGGIEKYNTWLWKAREILHCPDSPLSLKNGIWKVINRAELWKLLGSRILNKDLDTFKSLAVTVLKEPNPALKLPANERYMAGVYGKVLKHSHVLRGGIAGGLAILGCQPDACSNCSQGKAETTSLLAIHELLMDADWVLWGSLNSLLPVLAEAAPSEFLDAVEKALDLTPCPFDELFAQEGITGENNITGLLWALEGLAWDEQYLVRVCIALGELASHDPGGRWANRPSNSLITILLPWSPQTLASVNKRKVAVQTLLDELPDIAWNLIIQLLPGQHQISLGSHKPSWRKTIPDDWKKGVTDQEYWQQVSYYAERAVATAGEDTARLSTLIDHFDNLPNPAFDQLVEFLASQTISKLPEEQRLVLWDHLRKFTNKHRRHSDAEWALPDDLITRIEKVAEQLTPTNLFNLYQHLFGDLDSDLYEKNGDWEEQEKKLNARRETAIREIFQQNGIEGVIRFAESVVSPEKVGQALGFIADDVIEQTLLPHFLDTANNKHKALVNGFIWRQYQIKGWEWCDNIDKSGWTPKQIGHFLAYLPFTKDAWDRASKWLNENQGEYWSIILVPAHGQADGDLAIAVEELIKHGRPFSAIRCLERMRYAKQPINTKQCVRALRAARSSSEPAYAIDRYHIVELIKFLQSDPSVAQDDLLEVEWAYFPLLDRDHEATPKFLESGLASDPEFFCEVIRRIYRSKKEDQTSEEPTEESKAIAMDALRLLDKWKIPPGTQKDETFSEEHFNEWLQRVKTLCAESGHLEVALVHIGKVLIHAPPDPNGLWIHQTVATALNDRDAEDMRNGFWTGTLKSRGVYRVDPTGKPEEELAKQFKDKAEEVENASFHRFAGILRNLAENYEREAKRIVNYYKT